MKDEGWISDRPIPTDDEGRPWKSFRHVGMPIVTYNSARPDRLSIAMATLDGTFDFRLSREQGDRLRYLLGRSLDPASTPALPREAFD